MPTPLPWRNQAKDDEQCTGGHTCGWGSHACARGCTCKRRQWGEGESSACRGLSSTGKATSSGRSTTGGSSGGGEKYGSSSSAATSVGKLGAERRRSPQAPPRPIGEV